MRRGVTRTFQINTLFPGLTVLESVVLAVSVRRGSSRSWWVPLSKSRDEIDEAQALLSLLQLEREAAVVTASLPYGKQRLLEIALALATRPRVLLLDEPAAGVPEEERRDILAALAALPADVAILLIDHDMPQQAATTSGVNGSSGDRESSSIRTSTSRSARPPW